MRVAVNLTQKPVIQFPWPGDAMTERPQHRFVNARRKYGDFRGGPRRSL